MSQPEAIERIRLFCEHASHSSGHVHPLQARLTLDSSVADFTDTPTFLEGFFFRKLRWSEIKSFQDRTTEPPFHRIRYGLHHNFRLPVFREIDQSSADQAGF